MKRNVAWTGCAWTLAALLGGGGVASAADNPQLAFVPADSHLYVGTGKPFPIDALMSLMPNIPLPDAADFGDDDDDAKAFVEAYEGFMNDPAKVLSEWGINDELGFSLYTVGISPVLRVAINDGEKLLAKIDEFGESDSVKVSEIKRSGGSYRLYQPTEKEEVDVAILVGTDKQDAVIGVLLDASDLAMADKIAGFSKPEQSIKASGKLEQLRAKWDYGDDFLSFVDARQIADTLTNADSESGKQLNSLLATDPSAAASVAELRTPVCQQEINGIADVWPMLVAGYRDLEIGKKRINGSSHMAVEINHQQLVDTLQLFGGLIPGLGSNADAMLSVGLGLDVNKLSQGFGQLSQLTSSISFQCEALQGLNGLGGEALGGASMGVVMFSGMARGIRGISASIFDIDLDVEQLKTGQPGLEKADIAIAISADDPGALLQTLQMMPQMSGLGGIPLDGSSVALSEIAPLPLPPELDAEVAIKGKNVVLYRGEQASKFTTALQAGAKGQDDLLFNLMIDTKSAIGKVQTILDGMDIDTSDKDTKMLMDMMNSYPLGVMDLTFDFTSNGVEYLTNFEFDTAR